MARNVSRRGVSPHRQSYPEDVEENSYTAPSSSRNRSIPLNLGSSNEEEPTDELVGSVEILSKTRGRSETLGGSNHGSNSYPLTRPRMGIGIEQQQRPLLVESLQHRGSYQRGSSILRPPSQGSVASKSQKQDRWNEPNEDDDEDDFGNEEDEIDDLNDSTSSIRIGHSRSLSKRKDSNHRSSHSSGHRDKAKSSSSSVGHSSRDRERRQDVAGRTSLESSVNGNSGHGGPNKSSSRMSSRSGNKNRYCSSGPEIAPLPIEIPDTVTDEEAFRRYLSVRRGAVGPHLQPVPQFTETVRGGSGFRSSKARHLTPGSGGVGSFVVQRRSMALSHAIMTLALLSASASQLRFVVAYTNAHSYPALNYFLISSCMLIEILVGIGYVVLSRFEFEDRTLDKSNTCLIFGLFYVAISNIILSAFALDDHVCEQWILLKKNEQNMDTLDNYPPQLPKL